MRFSSLYVVLLSWIFSTASYALNCQQSRQLSGNFLRSHYSYNSFDDELSRRTLDNFLKAWDPGKVYFLQVDIDRLQNEYATKLDDMIQEGNCKAIDDILATYSTRFNERKIAIARAIDTKHDFSIDENMEIDRKTLPYPKTIEEANERWRKRIKFQYMQLQDALKDAEKIKIKLRKRYELAAKRQNEMTSDDVYAMFLNSFAQALDPHTDYMSADELEDFRINTSLKLEGIGAALRSEDGFTTIQSLVPGGAAAKTGKFKVDDKIIAVAQKTGEPVEVIDMDVRDVVKLIRGPAKTPVKLTIIREEAGKSIQFVQEVERATVQLTDRAAKGHVINVDGMDNGKKVTYRVGVVNLPSFYMDFEGRQSKMANFRSSSADMTKEINKLKKAGLDAIIVDLRMNGGGALDESIRVAGLFIDKGPVVQTKSKDGSIDVADDRDAGVVWDGPLAVLIDRQSASASEIFAGAIQDYGRGLILGDSHTFGKGTVQTLNDMPGRLGAFKVTISKFYRPSGSSTQLKGVESDIVFPDVFDEYELGEKYYDYALQWDQIKSADIKKSDEVAPYLSALRSSSESRIKNDEMFKKIAEEIKKYRDGAAERSHVSLKEPDAKERKERDEKLAQAKAKASQKQKDPDDEDKVSVSEDAQLQEAVRVAADYIRLMKKQPLLASMTIPEAKSKVVLAQTKTVKPAAKGKGNKKGAKTNDSSSSDAPNRVGADEEKTLITK